MVVKSSMMPLMDYEIDIRKGDEGAIKMTSIRFSSKRTQPVYIEHHIGEML